MIKKINHKEEKACKGQYNRANVLKGFYYISSRY